MVPEAALEEVGSGLAPVSEGWFVVNAADAAWVRNEAFGRRCVFESSPRVLQEREGVEPHRFGQIGYTLAILEPGRPTGMYHAESYQEDLFVLSGKCTLLIEEEERQLRAWDFVHCPPGTRHVLVATSDEPCAVLMVGARGEGHAIEYPRSELALARGAGVEEATASPPQAYAPFPAWRLERPPAWPVS